MKSTLTTCVGLLVAFFTYAHQSSSHDLTNHDINHYESFRCRSNYENIDPSLSLAEQLKTDLTSGIWIEETNTGFVHEMITFNASGKGEWIHDAGNQLYKKETISWTILDKCGELFLEIHSLNDKTEYFGIAANCKGIALSDMENNLIHDFEFVDPKEDYRLNNLREELIGKWENILPQIKLKATGNPEIPTLSLEGVKVVLDFRTDGQFQKSILSKDGPAYQENGRWEVSKDGQYIYLHCLNTGNGALTQAIKIKHFDLDELVLEQPLAIIGKSYSTDNKFFYFNKI